MTESPKYSGLIRTHVYLSVVWKSSQTVQGGVVLRLPQDSSTLIGQNLVTWQHKVKGVWEVFIWGRSHAQVKILLV